MYDYIIEKPELNEETLAHYGIKGMKWKKHLKGKYYSLKSKAGEIAAKRNRKKLGASYDPSIIINNSGYKGKKAPAYKASDSIGGVTSRNNPADNDIPGYRSGEYNKSSRDNWAKATGTESSNVERGIAAGRERVKKKKK